MAQTAGYPVPPTHFATYGYPQTPQRSSANNFYSTRHFSYSAPPQRGHTRRATAEPTTFNFTSPPYSDPRKAYYVPPEYAYATPRHYEHAQSTPLRPSDHVSYSDRKRGSTPKHHTPTHGGGKKQQRTHSGSKRYSARVVVVDFSDHEYEYLPRYEAYERQPPPAYRRSRSQSFNDADRCYYDQVPIYTPAAEPREKTRPRRSSHATKPAKPSRPTTTQRPRTATRPAPPPPQATEADARRHGVPAGFSLKNWDPTEAPILLLGSVFDANSLGKWIYDWTVFFYGAASPMSEVAGELWLSLIQLAGKRKQAEEGVGRIRRDASYELVDDFIKSGDRLWDRLIKLIKICESYMYKAARRENGGRSDKMKMGKNSGAEFVNTMFGRDRELDRTEKLMAGMELWSKRFDINCKEILDNPSA